MYSSNRVSARHGAVALILFALTAFSCSTDDEADTPLDDGEAPTVSLAGIPDDRVVWNVVTLTASATDNGELSKIEVEVDGKLENSSSQSPVEVRLNTQSLTDGEHTITARAIDKVGNEKTTETKITVRNILVSANVPSDIFWSDASYKGYILLSDENGKTIAVDEYHRGEPFELRAPNFEGSKFHLTEVFVAGTAQTVLRTYTGVKRGKWVITGFGHDSFNVNAGNAVLSFTNALENTDYTISGGNTSTTTKGQTPLSYTMYGNPSSKILITRRANGKTYPTHYTILPNPIEAGKEYTIDLSTVSEPTTEVTLTSEFSTGFVRLQGMEDPSRPTQLHAVTEGYCVNHELKYAYPGNAFPKYYSYYYYESGDGQYYHNRLDGLPNVTPLECTMDLAVTSTKFTGTLSGDEVDACFINLSQGSQQWLITTATGEQNIVLPEVPAVLSGRMVRSYQPSKLHVTAIDFSDFDGYEALLDYVRTTPYGLESFESTGTPRHRMYINYLFWDGGAGRHPAQ